MGTRGVWAEISLSALRQNLKTIRSHIAGGAKLCAVVKADAYGHGAVAVAREAVRQGADYLAVAVLSEAIALREAGFTTPILLLGPAQPSEADQIVHYGVTMAAFTAEQGQALSAAARRQGRTARVHLAVDTGMGRIGVRPDDAGEMAASLAGLPGLEVEGVFSHFALADARDKSYAMEQFRRFQAAVAYATPNEDNRGDKVDLHNKFTVITSRDVTLSYGDYIVRATDGLVLKVTSDGLDRKTPASAGLDMRAVTAEEMEGLPT